MMDIDTFAFISCPHLIGLKFNGNSNLLHTHVMLNYFLMILRRCYTMQHINTQLTLNTEFFSEHSLFNSSVFESISDNLFSEITANFVLLHSDET